jgi:hypothetical protein
MANAGDHSPASPTPSPKRKKDPEAKPKHPKS